jgi:hypothetical protein
MRSELCEDRPLLQKNIYCVGWKEVFGAGFKNRYPLCDIKNQPFIISIAMDRHKKFIYKKSCLSRPIQKKVIF